MQVKRTVSPGIIVLALLTAVLGFVLLPAYLYHLQNDSVSYLSIAAKYAAGDTHAVNAYWGPLFSWLIALGMQAGVPALLMLRGMNIIIAALIVLVAGSMLSGMKMREDVRWTGLVSIALLSLTYALDTATPDLLLTLLLLAYLHLSSESLAGDSAKNSVLIGMCAGIGFLTKSVALPFFLAHCFGTTLWKYVRKPNERLRTCAHALLTIAICGVISIPWIVTMSRLQGHITIGESAHFVHSTLNPLQTRQNPLLTRGLIAPPDNAAISAWDNPPLLASKDFTLLSAAGVAMQSKIIILNAVTIIESVFVLSWLSFGILLLAIAFCLEKKTDVALRKKAALLVATWAILLCAYLPIITDPRYFWLTTLLSILVGGGALSALFDKYALNGRTRIALLLGFSMSFVAYPLWTTANLANDGKNYFQIASDIGKTVGTPHPRIASDVWKAGLYVSYHANGAYYGLPKTTRDAKALESELIASDIDAYVVFGQVPALTRYKELSRSHGVHVLGRIER